MTALSHLDLDPADLLDDVYFDPAFVGLYAAPDPIDSLHKADFRHASAIRAIPQSPGRFDLETPHGYGGPVALTPEALKQGLEDWRAQQAAQGRIAEFIRFHPFINVSAYEGLLDHIALNRQVCVVDLAESPEDRWKRFSKGTRHAMNRARRELTLRQIDQTDAALFTSLYRAGLDRNQALNHYYYDEDANRSLLSLPYTTAWVAERDGVALAVSSFMNSRSLAHYHLSGMTAEGMHWGASYLLIEEAIHHYAKLGCRWMHLGGGRSAAPEDELRRFKMKFATIELPFYTGGLVHDRIAYEQMGGMRNGWFLGYRAP